MSDRCPIHRKFLYSATPGRDAEPREVSEEILDLTKSLERWRQGKSRGKKPMARSVRMQVDVILSA